MTFVLTVYAFSLLLFFHRMLRSDPDARPVRAAQRRLSASLALGHRARARHSMRHASDSHHRAAGAAHARAGHWAVSVSLDSGMRVRVNEGCGACDGNAGASTAALQTCESEETHCCGFVQNMYIF
jgi:hypothetical protein